MSKTIWATVVVFLCCSMMCAQSHQHSASKLNVGTSSTEDAWRHHLLHRAAFYHNGAVPKDSFTDVALQFEAEYRSMMAAHNLQQQSFTDGAILAEQAKDEAAQARFSGLWTTENADYRTKLDTLSVDYQSKLEAKVSSETFKIIQAQVLKLKKTAQSTNPDNTVASLAPPTFQSSYHCNSSQMNCNLTYSIEYSNSIAADGTADEAFSNEPNGPMSGSWVTGKQSGTAAPSISGGQLECTFPNTCFPLNTSVITRDSLGVTGSFCTNVSISQLGTGSNQAGPALWQNASSTLGYYVDIESNGNGTYIVGVGRNDHNVLTVYETYTYTASVGDSITLCDRMQKLRYTTDYIRVYLTPAGSTTSTQILGHTDFPNGITGLYPGIFMIGGSTGTPWGLSGWSAWTMETNYNQSFINDYPAHSTVTLSVLFEGTEQLTCDPSCPAGYTTAHHTPSAAVVYRGSYNTVPGQTVCVNCSVYANAVQSFTEQAAGNWTNLSSNTFCLNNPDNTPNCNPIIGIDGYGELVCSVIGPIAGTIQDFWGIVPVITVTYNTRTADTSAVLYKQYGNWNPLPHINASQIFQGNYLLPIPGVEVDYYLLNNYCSNSTGTGPIADYSSFNMAIPDAYYGQHGFSIGQCPTCAKVPAMSPLTAFVTLVWTPLVSNWFPGSPTTWEVAPDWATTNTRDTLHWPDANWNVEAFVAYFVPAAIAPLPAQTAEFCTPLLSPSDVPASVQQKFEVQ